MVILIFFNQIYPKSQRVPSFEFLGTETFFRKVFIYAGKGREKTKGTSVLLA